MYDHFNVRSTMKAAVASDVAADVPCSVFSSSLEVLSVAVASIWLTIADLCVFMYLQMNGGSVLLVQ